MNSPLLILLLLIPAAGALLGALLPVAAARSWALLISLATLLVAIIIACAFHYGAPGFQFTFDNAHLALPFNASFSLGIDSIALWLVLLTALLMPLAVLSSFESIKDRPREYYSWMLLLQAAMLGVFVARDILVFYIFFELTLIPMFFIIGIWGGPERRGAAGKFFLFTFTGSVFTLAGAIYLGYHAGHLRHRPNRGLCPQFPDRFRAILGPAGLAGRVLRQGRRSSPCTPGFPWPTPKPPRPAASSSRAFC